MIPAMIVQGIAAGVAELVQTGILAASQSEQATEVLLRNMKPTPASAEVDDYREAKAKVQAAVDGEDPSGSSER